MHSIVHKLIRYIRDSLPFLKVKSPLLYAVSWCKINKKAEKIQTKGGYPIVIFINRYQSVT